MALDAVVCVTGDHATPCILKDHSLDPVPIMIKGADTKDADKVRAFNEVGCTHGSLGHMSGKEIMPKLVRESRNV